MERISWLAKKLLFAWNAGMTTEPKSSGHKGAKLEVYFCSLLACTGAGNHQANHQPFGATAQN